MITQKELQGLLSTAIAAKVDALFTSSTSGDPTTVAVDSTAQPSLKDFTEGESVLIRTVTSISVGKVIGMSRTFVFLSSASWIADTGRYAECLRVGGEIFKDVEPSPKGAIKRVSLGAIVDVDAWGHDLPTETV